MTEIYDPDNDPFWAEIDPSINGYSKAIAQLLSKLNESNTLLKELCQCLEEEDSLDYKIINPNHTLGQLMGKIDNHMKGK